VDARTNRYHLVQARTQLTAYSDFEIAVAAIASPTGPRTAAKNGLGCCRWELPFGTVSTRWRCTGT